MAGRQPGARTAAPAPNARDQQVVDLLDDWVGRDAPRLDADYDGNYDEAGPTIMDAIWRPIAEAVMEPRVRRPARRRSTASAASAASPASRTSTRTCARCSATTVRGRFNLSLLRQGLARRVPRVALGCGRFRRRRARRRVRQRGSGELARTGEHHRLRARACCRPRFPTTNRPTFQQVLEFQHRSR